MSKTINNLNEFLAWRGCGDDPYSWARAFYKYTDCGPWVSFLVKGEPARDEKFSFIVSRHPDGKLGAVTNAPLVDGKPSGAPLPPADILQMFLFLPDGTEEPGMKAFTRTMKAYVAAVRKLQGDLGPRDREKITFVHEGPTDPKPGERRWVLITVERHVPETTGEVYYEDLRKVDAPVVDNDTCIGITIGSIVEGSEQCAGPYVHEFPFETEAFEESIADMERVTSFYWKRDNATWYRVTSPEGEDWVVADVWGTLEWEDDGLGDSGTQIPPAVKEAAEKTIENDWQPDPERPDMCIIQTVPKVPNLFGWGFRPTQEEIDKWKPMPLGDTGFTICSFDDDTDLD